MDPKKPEKRSGILLILCCWALPMSWVAAIPKSGQEARGLEESKELLTRGEATIRSFVKEFGEAPRNLAELKTYGYGGSLGFNGWDGFGQRFDYLRLSQTHWYLRSFGADGRQNTLLSHEDPIVSDLAELRSYGVIQNFPPHAIRYEPAIRAGAQSPASDWQGEIFADQVSGASRLLVRHLKNKTYFMSTEQDTVEEFYWLPDGYRIVFSATGSNRYRDGIYLWNLLSDDITRIFPNEAHIGIHTADRDDQQWQIALAGITASPPVVMAFAMPRRLAPVGYDEIFGPENFMAIEVKNDSATNLSPEARQYLYRHPLASQWFPGQHLHSCAAIAAQLRKWCTLPAAGPFQSVINDWQEFADSAVDSPVFPYTLLQLILLYNDSYGLMLDFVKSNPKNADAARNMEIVRSYGAEFAQALESQSSAPSWLRGFAGGAKQQLLAKTPLPYRSSGVIIQD